MIESVLITGTAGDIGLATGLAFGRAGYRVVGLDRAPSTALAGAPLDPPALAVEGDVGCDAALGRALALAAEDAALVHVVGTAGGSLDAEVAAERAGRLPEMDEFRDSVEQNLTLQFHLVARSVPHLRAAAHRGRPASVALLSSINSLAGYGLPAYSAAKAGLAGLAVALAGPLGADGIRINALALGTTPTTATRRRQGSAEFDAFERETALGRLGTPEQVGATLLALATAMTHTTGQVLVADGGQLVHRTAGH